MRHTISVLVENKFGVLARISTLFAARGFNIDSLSVGETENPDVSRMTIIVQGDDRILEQVEKQLNKLVDVIKVLVDLSKKATHERDDLVRTLRGESAHIMEQSRYVIPVPITENAHRGNASRVVLIGNIPFRRGIRADTIQHLDLSRMGKKDLFTGMRDHLVRKDDNGCPKFLRKVKCFDGYIEAVLSR